MSDHIIDGIVADMRRKYLHIESGGVVESFCIAYWIRQLEQYSLRCNLGENKISCCDNEDHAWGVPSQVAPHKLEAEQSCIRCKETRKVHNPRNVSRKRNDLLP